MAEATPHAQPLTLTDGRSRAEVHPATGAAIRRYDVLVDGVWQSIFDASADGGRAGPFALGCNLLLPFSNRIAGGGFRHEGRFHALEPNLPGSRYPIHGNAFAESWTVVEAHPATAALHLDSSGPGPFRYAAEFTCSLRDGALAMALAARNTGAHSLPFGAGFHPWFVRTPGTRLTMRTAGAWAEDEEHLPTTFHPTGDPDGLEFSGGAPLPAGWINNAFTGWDGVARIDWPDRGLSATIQAEPPLTTAIVYSPSADSGFFCLEPVSHSVDAHNRSGPGTAPPQVLAPGETLTACMTITPGP
jgi:aldose 1-epimerase